MMVLCSIMFLALMYEVWKQVSKNGIQACADERKIFQNIQNIHLAIIFIILTSTGIQKLKFGTGYKFIGADVCQLLLKWHSDCNAFCLHKAFGVSGYC